MPETQLLVNRLVVELVGPGGVGKSSSLRHVRDSDFLVVSPTRALNLGSKLGALSKALRLGLRHRLGFRDSVGLWRKCSSVESGLHYLRQPPSARVIIMDEGPLRTLRDMRCKSYEERGAWTDFARISVREMGAFSFHFVVIELMLEESLRVERYRRRESSIGSQGRRSFFGAALDRLSGPRNCYQLPPLNFELDEIIQEYLVGRAEIFRLAVGETEGPERVGHKIIDVIKSINP